MTYFDKHGFNKFILDNNLIGFSADPIPLKSGRESHFYVNWRRAVEDTHGLEFIARAVIAYTHDMEYEPTNFIGVPEGATPLGTIAQFLWATEASGQPYTKGSHSMGILRAKPKEHGKPEDRYFVGSIGEKVIVLEDVTTTGGSLITTIKQLQERGKTVIAAYGLTNRNEKRDDGKSVEEAILELGVTYHALSDALQLLPLAAQRLRIDRAILDKVEAEFQQYGVQPLHFPK